MNMLKCFLELGADRSLFNGLAIEKETELMDKHFGKYPVIYLSLKDVIGVAFEEALSILKQNLLLICTEYENTLLQSTALTQAEKNNFQRFLDGNFNAVTLGVLSRYLYQTYNHKVAVIIDEYNVPLNEAYENGYYDQMVKFIRGMLSSLLKSKEAVGYGVLTGCLRVSKESIFTGFNNLIVKSILDNKSSKLFGFTPDEVKKLLSDIGKSEYYDLTKEWYDGYKFGISEVYNPWDVICWCSDLINGDNEPKCYWLNSSGNTIIRHLAENADATVRYDLETLISGSSISKQVHTSLTYEEMYERIDNIWSFMLMTGYLTVKEKSNDKYSLVIPNKEVLAIYENQIFSWFIEKIRKEDNSLEELFKAQDEKDSIKLEACLDKIFKKSISFYDSGKDGFREKFYHGVLLGMLLSRKDYVTSSNLEAKDGRFDIVTYSNETSDAYIYELKYAQTYEEMDAKVIEANNQIDERRYDSYFKGEEISKITHISIAFCKKRCKVMII